MSASKPWMDQPRDAKGRWAKIRAGLNADFPIDAKNVVDKWDQATEGERATGMEWYPNAHKIATAMAKRYDVDVETAAGLIAAYSTQTRWGANLIRAHSVLRTGTPVGGPGAHIFADVTPLDDVDEARRGVMATRHARKRAEKLLAGENFHEVFAGKRNKNGTLPPKALKIRAFADLIARGGQPEDRKVPAVVIDRHAASVARGVRFSEDMYVADGPSSSGKKFKAYADAYREAAEVISAREGRTIPPEAVQAVTWLVQQRLNQDDVAAADALGARDSRESLGYFAQYAPDIADIIDEPMVGYAELSNPGAAGTMDLTSEEEPVARKPYRNDSRKKKRARAKTALKAEAAKAAVRGREEKR